MWRRPIQPKHLSRILWACVRNCAAASAATGRKIEVKDSLLASVLYATLKENHFTASEAVAVQWCVARLRSIKARRRGLRNDRVELESWDALGDFPPRAAALFYERAEDLSLDEREAGCWALTQLAGGVDHVGERVDDGDGVSSPPEKEFVINAHGRLVRSRGSV